MEKFVTLEEALKIEKLEKESADLREKLGVLQKLQITKRTIYRYKVYYDKVRKKRNRPVCKVDGGVYGRR